VFASVFDVDPRTMPFPAVEKIISPPSISIPPSEVVVKQET